MEPHIKQIYDHINKMIDFSKSMGYTFSIVCFSFKYAEEITELVKQDGYSIEEIVGDFYHIEDDGYFFSYIISW